MKSIYMHASKESTAGLFHPVAARGEKRTKQRNFGDGSFVSRCQARRGLFTPQPSSPFPSSLPRYPSCLLVSMRSARRSVARSLGLLATACPHGRRRLPSGSGGRTQKLFSRGLSPLLTPSPLNFVGRSIKMAQSRDVNKTSKNAGFFLLDPCRP